MRIWIVILISFFFNYNLSGQIRTIKGKVISEDFDPLAMVHIQTTDRLILGKTDFEGQFEINLPIDTAILRFEFTGMEQTEILLDKNCDTVEIIMLNYAIYDYASSSKIDRLRKEDFKSLKIKHIEAVEKGLFKSNSLCYQRYFVPIKPDLDRINKKINEVKKTNKENFKTLNIGAIVKIPFEIDASEKRVKTYYSLCEKCTEKDYSYVITGEIVDKNNKNLTLEIKVTEMPIYDFLLYNGKIVKVGDNIKYEMKYSKVIIY
jgi:hypothetical protein